MPLELSEQKTIEDFIKHLLRDVSRPNPFSLKAGIRILIMTNIATFEQVSSPNVQRDLSDLKKILQHPETLVPKSSETEAEREEVIQYIKQTILDNLYLLNKRTSILPNTYTIQKSIREGEHLKSVIHTSALKNVVTSAHYVDSLEKRFKNEGISEEKIEEFIKKALSSTQALHKAVIEGDITNILQCLAVHGVDVNFPNEQGMTPLHLATREGLTETAKLLLTVPDINVNSVSNNGWTPLHIAARMGYADIVDALLMMPMINVNAVNSDGWTPLHWGAWHGFVEVVTLLLSAPGIEINKIDRTSTTPLHWAARNGHPDVIHILLSFPNINVNAIDNDKRTALHFAVTYNHTQAVKVLLQAPTLEVNLADTDGLTPLHWAARNGETEIVQALLTHRDIRTEDFDNNWMTPLDWAIQNEHLEIARILNPHFTNKSPKKSLWHSFVQFLKKPFKRLISEQ